MKNLKRKIGILFIIFEFVLFVAVSALGVVVIIQKNIGIEQYLPFFVIMGVAFLSIIAISIKSLKKDKWFKDNDIV